MPAPKRARIAEGATSSKTGILKNVKQAESAKSTGKAELAATSKSQSSLNGTGKTARIAKHVGSPKGKERALPQDSDDSDKEEAALQDTAVNTNANARRNGLSAHIARESSTSKSSSSKTSFEIVAGSYERFLYGLHCTLSGSGQDATVDIQPIFQFPAHISAVKTVHASPNGKWLVTGSGDEVIKLWDLRQRKEIGGLLAHEGASLRISIRWRRV